MVLAQIGRVTIISAPPPPQRLECLTGKFFSPIMMALTCCILLCWHFFLMEEQRVERVSKWVEMSFRYET